MVNHQRQKRTQQNPSHSISEELLEVSQEFWQEQYAQSAAQQPAPIQQPVQQSFTPLQQHIPVQQAKQSAPTTRTQKPMEQNTFETVKLVPQSPGELRNLAKQAELTKKLQRLQNRPSNSFEEDLADGARAAGQTGRIVVQNANPFTGPVRAYAYLSIIATSVGLGMLTLHLLGALGGKVASNVKVQVKYGEQPTQVAPSRLTTGRGTPPVVDWVPGGR